MTYSDFNLKTVTKNFDLAICEQINMFANVLELEPSPLLLEFLKHSVPIALSSNTEKARSEMITAPILIELRKQFNDRNGLFSGIDFTVDIEKGLHGNCDFLISGSARLLILTAPVVAIVVEAKNEDIIGGLGQCVAEMLAAKIFNERENNQISTIYGAVTSGNTWRFLKLKEQIIGIDLTEYYLIDINKILGILATAIQQAI